MILAFSYNMELEFSFPVKHHFFKLQCTPPDTAKQSIRDFKLEVYPSVQTSSYANNFGGGAPVVYGCVEEEHDTFRVTAMGVAETGKQIYDDKGGEVDAFAVETALTRPGKAIRELYKELCKNAPEAPYDRAFYFMNAIYEKMQYVPGTTDISTPAEEALVLGRGVCQDYAHIFISLLRLDGIPARYTVGLLLGEGESHAWAEAYLKGYWYGMDPTNKLLTDDHYIKIVHGRDFSDCVISRGVFTGLAQQSQKITVSVAEISQN